MKSAKFGRSVSACELPREAAEGCVSMCGMCPACAFAPKPPGSAQRLWKVSDEFKRRFVVDLLLRCRNIQVLESIQSVLGVTSWTLFTYARSRSPASPQDYPCRGTDRAPDWKPLGMDLNEIWDWFSSSPGWIQSRYLCRLFSLCDLELLRMVANLTSVLLVRQKRGFLQFNGKNTTHSFTYSFFFFLQHSLLNLYRVLSQLSWSWSSINGSYSCTVVQEMLCSMTHTHTLCNVYFDL